MRLKTFTKVTKFSISMATAIMLLGGCATVQTKTTNSPISGKIFKAQCSAFNYIINGKPNPALVSKITKEIENENYNIDKVTVKSPLDPNNYIYNKIAKIKKETIIKKIKSLIEQKKEKDISNNIINNMGNYNCNFLKKRLISRLKLIKIPFTITKHNGLTCSWNWGRDRCFSYPDKYERKMLSKSVLMIDHYIPIHEGWLILYNHRQEVIDYAFTQINFKLNFLGCKKNNNITTAIYTFTPKNIYIQNASSGVQTLATVNVDWKKIEQELSSIKCKFNQENYISKLVVDEIANRYKSLDENTIKIQKIYRIPPKIFISRIERALNFYKFNKKTSLYIFDKGKIIVSPTYYTEPLTLSFSVFPEINNQSAVIYKIKFYPIYDKIIKREIFSYRDAKTIMSILLKRINEVIRNP